MKVNSFNDFKYIFYIEGKDRALKKLFSNFLSDKDISLLYERIENNDINLMEAYEKCKKFK